jgi:curved DNA-binding protein CbpA
MLKSYYEILDVPVNASDSTIKKRFRQLAVKLHSDKGGDDDQFVIINEAYLVLIDPVRRRQHDQEVLEKTTMDPLATAKEIWHDILYYK